MGVRYAVMGHRKGRIQVLESPYAVMGVGGVGVAVQGVRGSCMRLCALGGVM